MATNIRLKSSSVSNRVPTLSDLSLRELAINTTDGRVFLRKGNGTVTDVIVDVTDHGSFYGLADDDHTQYLHSTITRTGVTAELNTTGKITTTNRVGIGTTNPLYKLEVYQGNLSAGGGVGDAYFLTYADVSGANVSIEAINRENTIKKNLTLNAYGGNVLVGTSLTTGTASQPLQVNGGAYVSGSVGIGTTTPTATLHVSGSGIFSDGNIIMRNIGGTSALEIGQGQTSNQFALIDLIGDATYTDYGLRIIRGNTGANSKSNIYHRGTGAFELFTVDSAPIDFYINSGFQHRIDTSGNFLINTTSVTGTSNQKLQVNSGAYVSGSVGIGTTNPLYKTHIVGSGDILAIESTSASDRTTLKLLTNGSDWEVGVRGSAASPANAFYIYDNAANAYRQVIDPSGNVLLGTGTATGTASQRLQVIDGAYISGNVGIGVTNPGSKLAVNGYITESTDGTNYYNVVSQQDVGLNPNQIPLNQYLGQLAFMDEYSPSGLRRAGGGSDDLLVDSVGRIGIGTTNPQQELHVYAATGTADIRIEGGGVTGRLMDVFSGSTIQGLYGYGTVDMVFATNNQERLRIGSDGGIGIGGPNVAGYGVLNSKNITGGVTAYGFVHQGVVASDVTNGAIYFISSGSTAASSFTLGTLTHFQAQQGIIGSGSAVTNQIGFNVSATLVGATNNYGYFANIPSGTNRWNFYAGGTAQNYFAGNVGIGTAVISRKLHVYTNTSSAALFVSEPTASPANNDSSELFTLLRTATDSTICFSGSDARLLTATVTPSNEIAWRANKLALIATDYIALKPNNGVEAVRITSTQNVGVGRTNPVEKFESSGAIVTYGQTGNNQTSAGSFDYSTSTSGGARLLSWGASGVAGTISFWTGNGGGSATERVRILGTGAVGIATTAPLATLSIGSGSIADGNIPVQINAPSGGMAYYGANNNGSYGALFGYDSTWSGAVVRAAGAADNLNLVVNNTTRAVVINSLGNVGIANTSPSARLHIGNSDTVDNTYLKVGGSGGTTRNYRYISVPVKSTAAGTADTKSVYVGKFYIGIHKLQVYVSGGFAEVGFDATFYKNWSSSSIPGIIVHNGYTSLVTFHYQNIDNESYYVFISYVYNAAAPINTLNDIRLDITSVSSLGTFVVGTTPTIPTLNSSNRMNYGMVVNDAGKVGVGNNINPTSSFDGYGILRMSSSSSFESQIISRNDANDATAAYFILDKSKGGAQVTTGDLLGTFIWRGMSTGGSIVNSLASISAYAGGTGSTFIPAGLQFNASTSFSFVNSTNSANLLSILSGGSVGIGSTNPTTKLDVAGMGQFTNNGATLNLVGTDHSYIQWFPDGIAAGRKGYMGWGGIDVDYFTIQNQITGGVGHIVLQHGSGTAAAVLVNTSTATGTANQSLQVNNGAYISGNVGIGTTTPTTKLDVIGNSRIGGAATRSTSGLTVGFTNNTTFSANSDIGDGYRMLSIVNESTTTNAMSVLGFRINPDTANANAMLDVKFVQTGATNTSALHYTFNHAGSFVDRFSILSNGNIGIGTISPVVKLDVGGETAQFPYSIRIRTTAHATSKRAAIAFGTGASHQILVDTNGNGTEDFSIYQANINRSPLKIEATTGNIHIGKPPVQSAPTELSVNGYISESTDGGTTFYNVVSQQDVGLNPNQIPLNQYLGQLAFMDEYSPSGLRRAGGGSDDVFVNSSGLVGIGTTVPSGSLDIANSGPQWGQFNYGTNLILKGARNNGLGILDFANSNPWWIGNGGGTLYMATMPTLGDTTTAPNIRMAITSTGNVGIGITNPTVRFLNYINTDGSLYTSTQNAGTGANAFTALQITAGDASAYYFINSQNRASDGGTRTATLRNDGGDLRLQSAGAVGITVKGTTGNVGIDVASPTYKLQVNGSFAATTKSFVIDHPTKPGFKLRYGSLEGPENGVYIRGRLSDNNTIELPEYWTELVHEDSITVNLTPIGRNPGIHSVIDISNNTIVIESTNDVINCFFTVFAERKDVEKLITEYES